MLRCRGSLLLLHLPPSFIYYALFMLRGGFLVRLNPTLWAFGCLIYISFLSIYLLVNAM